MCRKLILLVPLIWAALGQISHAGLVAYWDLEEGSGAATAAAVGSPQADGRLVGATWITAGLAPTGGTNAAVFFKSTSADRVETTYPGVLGQAARSVTAWIRAEAVQTNAGVMVGWGANANNQRYSVRFNKTAADGVLNALRLEIQGSRAVATTPINDRQWHHIAVTHGAGALIGQVSFYLDGKLEAISGTSGGALIDTASTSVVLGNSPHATATYGYDGAIDEVRIYDHVLTQAEIQQIMKGAPAGQASGPNPADKATDVPADATLNWTAGETVGTHDVYFGTAFADVNTASRTDAKGALVSRGQTDATFDPAGLLAYGQTYYWRIDEVNKTPDNTIFKGETWSFTAEPYGYPVKPVAATASSAQAGMGPEKTIDGSGLTGDRHGVEATTMWLSTGAPPNWVQYEFDKVYKLHDLKVWNSNQLIEAFVGFGAKKVTIETSTEPAPAQAGGTTWTTLANVPEFAKATGAGYAANTTVNLGGVQAKYVKLTIDTSWGGMATTGLSEVRFSYVPVQARAPQPANAAVGVSLETDLNWRPGREAASHNVFFGTDPNALTAAQTVTDHRYTPASLSFGTKYYWKVDEVNAVTYPGDVWSFTTQEYAVVDDFESYTDEEGNRIFDIWVDGWTNNTGSVIGNLVAPFAERTIIHGGKQSMPMDYNNIASPFYSEAELAFAPNQNWTVNGATHLSLWVRGNPANFVDKGNGAFTVSGSGHDIWDNADDFRFVFKRLTGDGSVTAKVESIGNTNGWAKAGVMIREALTAGSTHAAAVITPSNGMSFPYRTVADGASLQTNTTGLVAPFWLRITRTGNVFKAERSPDGKTWTAQDTTQTISMPASVYIGLCVSSHNTAATTTAEFSGVATTGNVTGAWQHVWLGDDPDRSNGAASLYVAVEDSTGKVAVASDPALVNAAAWTEWKVPLTSLTGVNLAKVKKLYLGVGDRKSPVPDGAGRIYIDDIGFGHPAK